VRPATTRWCCVQRDLAFIVFTTSTGPSPGANARRNASIEPSGFLRSVTLRWSNAVRNTKRPSRPASGGKLARARSEAMGSGIGIGTWRTGTRDTAAKASATNREPAQISSTRRIASRIPCGMCSSSQNQYPIIRRVASNSSG
jgi:hypothetical protein